MQVEELAKLCKSEQGEVKKALDELKKFYEERQGSLMVVEEGYTWKITVREGYLPLVSKIVTETELSKTLIETLAVVAWKAPVLQSKVIGIRTNKAYDHLSYLEEAGYILREKHGRTKMIKLGQKFFEYFDLPPESYRERFSRFEDIEKMITAREQEAKIVNQTIELKKEEHKKQEEKKEKLSEEEHEKIDRDIEALEKETIELAEEHEGAVEKRWGEEEETQEWKAIRLRKKKKELGNGKEEKQERLIGAEKTKEDKEMEIIKENRPKRKEKENENPLP